MSAERSRQRFSRGLLASASWYAKLAELCADGFTAAMMIGLAAELRERLQAQSVLILRYPPAASPQLLHGQADHPHRANRIEDYLLGHYVLDPFYVRREHCSAQAFIWLREVIEEDFSASEYYKSHYEAAGLIDEMCFCCADGEGGHLNFSLSRTRGQEHFAPRERDAARALTPLVTAALHSSWRALCSETRPVRTPGHSEHHQHIENARLNFGRSLLSGREFEILQHLLHGKSVDFIAQRLQIAVSTVKVHRKHIYSKLRINSQAEIFTLLLEVVAETRYEPGRDPLASFRSNRPHEPAKDRQRGRIEGR